MLRIVIATAYVPFRPAREQSLAACLEGQFRSMGHQADRVVLPFREGDGEADQLLAFRLLDLEEAAGTPIDRLITLRGPAGVLRHSRKVSWLVETYPALAEADTLLSEAATDLYSRPAEHRHLAELVGLREAHQVVPASPATAHWLHSVYRIAIAPALHPPPITAEPNPSPPGQGGFLVLSSSASFDRNLLVLEALRFAHSVRLVFRMAASSSAIQPLRQRAEQWGVAERVRFAEGNLAEQLRDCSGVVSCGRKQWAPEEGVLEAFQARRPVVATVDSAATAHLIQSGANGVLLQPDPRLLATQLDRLRRIPSFARDLAEGGYQTLKRLRISWETVAEGLLK